MMLRMVCAMAMVLLIASPSLAFSPFLVERARADIGKSARDLGLHRMTLWCSEYLRKMTGRDGVDDRAISWMSLPRTSPRVGAIAVLRRGKNGGHVGVVSGFDGRNPKIISGNHNGVVGEGVYPRSRVIAWVTP